MGTIRTSIETIFAAVAFAERNRPAEASYLLKAQPPQDRVEPQRSAQSRPTARQARNAR